MTRILFTVFLLPFVVAGALIVGAATGLVAGVVIGVSTVAVGVNELWVWAWRDE